MFAYTTDGKSSVPFNDNYTYDYGDEYMYSGYSFERPVYLYLWEILVVITFFQNLLILLVFLHRTMRSPTNTILSAIAISDSLTGLVTLPTYIMVFQRYDPLQVFYYDDYVMNQSQKILYQYDRNFILYPNSNNIDSDIHFSVTQSSEMNFNTIANGNRTLTSSVCLSPTLPPVDGYILSKSLCQAFMISKYFLSRSFHTVSIFLTLFLEIQRYISVAYPYRYKTCLNSFRIVRIYCISAFILCPLLHVYHLGSDKAVGGLCHWELTETDCEVDCIYLWLAFVVRHFVPCVTLVIFTVLFILKLRKGQEIFRRLDGYSSQFSKRVSDNRRISFVVTSVVIVRLVPEIPYSILLLYNGIDVTVNMGRDIELETNRVFHMCYEICLVLSFFANFYIYLIINKSFRKRLYRRFIEPILRHIRDVLTFTRSRVYLLK